MKNAYYFSHDYNARHDPKLIKLLMKKNAEGIGVYWMLVEMLYEQDGYLMLSECDSYAFDMRTQCDLILDIIKNTELFQSDGERFWSETVLRRLEKQRSKSENASKAAKIKWGNANAMQTHSDRNAKKGKERKGKEKKIILEVPFNSEKFLSVWDEWIKYRIGIKKTLTPLSIKKQYTLLAKYTEDVAISIIEKSITNGWHGLFEPKSDNLNKDYYYVGPIKIKKTK